MRLHKTNDKNMAGKFNLRLITLGLMKFISKL